MHALRLGESLRTETTCLERAKRGKDCLKRNLFILPSVRISPSSFTYFKYFFVTYELAFVRRESSCCNSHATAIIPPLLLITPYASRISQPPSRAKYSLTRASFRFPPHDESLGSRLARNTVVLPQIREGKSIRRFRAFAPPPLSSRVSFITPVSPRVHTRDTLERERVVDLLLLLVVEGLIDPF